MRSHTYKFFALVILSILCIGCSDDDGGVDFATQQLSGTWEASSVSLNGFDVTSPSFDDFAILFREDGSYFTQDGDPIFTEAGGFWAFLDGRTDVIRLVGTQGEVEVFLSINEDATQLVMTFSAEGFQLGADNRASGLEGNYVFNLEASDIELE